MIIYLLGRFPLGRFHGPDYSLVQATSQREGAHPGHTLLLARGGTASVIIIISSHQLSPAPSGVQNGYRTYRTRRAAGGRIRAGRKGVT